MANAEMKILEAERLHQPMIADVSIIPTMPLKRKRRKQEVTFHSFSMLDTVSRKADFKSVLFKVKLVTKVLSNTH